MTDSFESELRSALGDNYEIERELTGSGMSRVFVAVEKSLSRKVVVKVLPPDLAAGVNRERFRREIQLAAQLQHPHIVPLHAAGSAGDVLYFTMPYIEGESLRHALHEGVRFSPREVVRTLHDVADALAYAHSRGVIHRDIKPGNVLRSGSHAVVTDFGVAKAISAAMPAVGMTTSGMAIGTPAYMAPEQLAGDPAADHRVDLYALGLLGYELLAGEAPFKASSPQETMAAQLTRNPEPISKRRPDAPAALAALLTRCLAKNPADRPQTATEVVSLLDSLEVSSGAMAPMRAFTSARMWIAAGTIAVAASIAVAMWPRSNVPTPPTPPLGDTANVVQVPITQPPVLTREDSLAIARAIQKKIGEQNATVTAKAESVHKQPKPGSGRSANASASTSGASASSSGAGEALTTASISRIVDSLRAEIQKAVLDSVTRVQGIPPGFQFMTGDEKIDSMVRRLTMFGMPGPGRGPNVTIREHREPRPPRSGLSSEDFVERAKNLGPPRRLLVTFPTLSSRWSFLAPQVDSLVDSLRATLRRDPRYVLVPVDSVRAALAKTRSVTAIAESLHAELFAAVLASVMPDTSLLFNISTRDLGAHGAFSMRNATLRGARPDLLKGIDALVLESARNLKEQDRAPRRIEPPDRRPQ